MIRKLWLKYKEYILYLFFGGVTTVVSYAVYFLMTRLLGSEEVFANTVGWIFGVATAYVTNRIWVFESRASGFGPVMKEIGEFALARVTTLVTEDLIIFIFVDRLGFSDIIIKIIASVITIVLNYVFSKFIIFRKKRSEEDRNAED